MSAMESSRHNMSKKGKATAEDLKMFHNLDSGDSGGGDPSDLSGVHENTSSESDSECVLRKKRRLSPATR